MLFLILGLGAVRLTPDRSGSERLRALLERVIHGVEASLGPAIEACLRKTHQHTAECLSLRQSDASGLTRRILKKCSPSKIPGNRIRPTQRNSLFGSATNTVGRNVMARPPTG